MARTNLQYFFILLKFSSIAREPPVLSFHSSELLLNAFFLDRYLYMVQRMHMCGETKCRREIALEFISKV